MASLTIFSPYFIIRTEFWGCLFTLVRGWTNLRVTWFVSEILLQHCIAAIQCIKVSHKPIFLSFPFAPPFSLSAVVVFLPSSKRNNYGANMLRHGDYIEPYSNCNRIIQFQGIYLFLLIPWDTIEIVCLFSFSIWVHVSVTICMGRVPSPLSPFQLTQYKGQWANNIVFAYKLYKTVKWWSIPITANSLLSYSQ